MSALSKKHYLVRERKFVMLPMRLEGCTIVLSFVLPTQREPLIETLISQQFSQKQPEHSSFHLTTSLFVFESCHSSNYNNCDLRFAIGSIALISKVNVPGGKQNGGIPKDPPPL